MCLKFSNWSPFPSWPFASRQYLCDRIDIFTTLQLGHYFCLVRVMLKISDSVPLNVSCAKSRRKSISVGINYKKQYNYRGMRLRSSQKIYQLHDSGQIGFVICLRGVPLVLSHSARKLFTETYGPQCFALRGWFSMRETRIPSN